MNLTKACTKFLAWIFDNNVTRDRTENYTIGKSLHIKGNSNRNLSPEEVFKRFLNEMFKKKKNGEDSNKSKVSGLQ